MMSIRKLVCKPKVDDWAPLAKFYYADENLNSIAAELDCFDGAKDPEKNQRLINQLRHCQDRIIQIIEEILNDVFPDETDRARRDYRVKFPDDIIHEGLAGQLWFGAECLSAGTNIVDRPLESESIRPLARRLCQQLDGLRDLLKEQSLKNPYGYTDKLKKHLRLYDELFAEFELKYVSVMIPVKSSHEYDLLQEVCVLFSETLLRAIKKGFISQDMIDMCDPSIMITLPRLAIVCGLLIYPEGPLNVDNSTENLAEMFQSFKTLLQKI
uniref:Lateral signaling target protein 2 homolog n=1 Tax=Romanomermis culicivorax TaxID=13658 RepID=A0A915KMH3_ROMCU